MNTVRLRPKERQESCTPIDCYAFLNRRLERPVLTFVGGWNGHVAEYYERLLNGDGLDHQIPDCRVDRLSAYSWH
jgi:hypothetical protein